MDSQTETAFTVLERLEREHGRKLKDIATTSMRSHTSGMKYRPRVKDPLLKEKSGVYITLRNGTELRGNAGFIYPTYELWNATRMSAVNAAFIDPRFKPVERNEIDLLDIEISVIGQVEKLRGNTDKDFASIKIGTDGIMVVGLNTSSVMLPQVAMEMDLEPVGFIEAACESAGLPENAWTKKGVSLYRFSTRIF
jgi:AmmeMemoRadiSam system protein A